MCISGKNNTSIVVMLLYEGVLFVCPGDIEPNGWKELWRINGNSYSNLIARANWRILVAPHHGRKSGYSEEMVEIIRPHVVLISDVWGQSETHPYYRRSPIGITFPDGDTVKYYSTKRSGRVRIQVSESSLIMGQYDT